MQPSYQSGFYAPGRGVAKHPELWRGCVGAWNPGLGNTGLSLRDWSGNQNNGTLTNILPVDGWATSGGKTAIICPGTAGYGVTIPHSTGLSIPASSGFSISLWFRRNTLGRNDGVLNKAASGPANNEWSIVWYGASLYFVVGDPANSAFIGRSGPANFTGWMHICCTYSGGATSSACSIFVDGVQVDSTNYQIGTFTAVSYTTNPVRLAIDNYLSGTTGFGDFDDIRIYNRTLSPNEVRTLAQRPSIAFERAPRKTYFIPTSTSTSQFYDILSPLIFAGTN